jgi:peptide deformylase
MIFGVEKKNPRYPTAGLVPQTVLINPEFVVVDETPVEFFEGCLSVPGLRGPVLRPTAIRYKGLTVEGEVIEREVDGFHARVFQHEMDHLDGILFPMRVKDFTRFGFTEELEVAGHVPRAK